MAVSRIHSLLFFVTIFTIFLTVRLWSLGYDMSNSDALRWHVRSDKFFWAIKNGDFKSTYQHYQPGVTLMLSNLPVKQIFLWYQYKTNDAEKSLGNADFFPIMDGVSKSVVVLILFANFAFHLYLISKIFDAKVGMIYAFFVTFEPYVIGIDRWFHVTSLEAYFAFSSFLCVLYATKSDKRLLYILSGIFLAFSALAKVTSIILFVVLFLMVVSPFCINRKYLINLLLIALAFVATIFVFFPALWVDPLYVYTKMFSAVQKAVTNDIVSQKISGVFSYLFYPLVFGFKSSPVVFGVFILALFSFREQMRSYGVKYLLLYTILYYLVLSTAEQKIDRYIISIFLPIILYLAVFVSRLGYKSRIVLASVHMLFGIWTLYTYFPVISAYYSPIFGGTKTAISSRSYDNSGEYYAQAAFYLNLLSRSTTVFVPFNKDAFTPFYNGTLAQEFNQNVDYVVTSVEHLKDIASLSCALEKTFGSRDMDITYLYKCNNAK